MTFQDILTDAYRRLNYNDTPDAIVTARLTAFANERHRRLLSLPAVSNLRDASISIKTAVGQATYGLPASVGRVKAIRDMDNGRRLECVTLDLARSTDPEQAPGSPESWVQLGFRQIHTPVPAATTLWVKSTSASDAMLATVESMRTNETPEFGAYPAITTATLSGNTAVQLGAGTDHVSVTKFFLASPANGYVTLRTANGVTLATISPGQRYARYLTIELHPIPTSVVTLRVDYTRELGDITAAADEPLLPPDFHYLIGIGIRLDEYEHRDDSRRVQLLKEWNEGVRHLIHWTQNTPGLVIVPGGASTGHSSLGGMFPAGS